MECRILAICDEQTTYMDFLTKQWLRKEEEEFQICRFATKEQLLEFAKRQKNFLLLVSEMYEDIIQEVCAKQCYCFTNDRDRDGQRRGKIQYIYRFQAMDVIYRRICESHQEEIIDEKEIYLVGIYNPVHRNGQTSFAKALAREYARQGKQVLYLNMEEYSGESDQQESGCLGEVLYYLKKDIKSINYRLASFTKKRDGYEYIAPMQMSQELREISCEEWCDFLAEITGKSAYQMVILDLDSCIQGIFTILELCDQIYMPIRKAVGGGRKRKQFYDNLKRIQKDEILEKIMGVEIPTFEDISEMEESSWKMQWDEFMNTKWRG